MKILWIGSKDVSDCITFQTSWNFVPPFSGERGQGRGLVGCESTQGGGVRKAKINIVRKRRK